MSALHPLAPEILPYCRKYSTQAAPLFQAFMDLSLAQSWSGLEVIELEEYNLCVLRGKPKKKTVPSIVLPLGLSTPTSLAQLTSVYKALDTRFPPSPSSDTSPAENEPIYLAIAEKDSSVVYYVLRQGIVSPKEVPE